MRALKVAALGLFGMTTVAGGLVGYELFGPTAAASAPLQAVEVDGSGGTGGAATAPIYEIRPGTSRARFAIDEVLNGAPVTVIGTTDQVAGQIALDPNDADAARVGTIVINARTFATDNARRDQAIQNWVLDTGVHEYVAFTPTRVVGLPEVMTPGAPASFQIVGDLTIRDVTRQVTFDATVTPASSDRLEGSAVATVRYADWGISIPQVPMVASVSDRLQLSLDFVATAA
jgi:polyisoprenoid-binding protein YceI